MLIIVTHDGHIAERAESTVNLIEGRVEGQEYNPER